MRDVRPGSGQPPGANAGVAGVPRFAMVVRMPDNTVDPSGNTEAFRAFNQHAPEEPAAPSKTPLIIGVAVAAVVVIAIIAWIAFS